MKITVGIVTRERSSFLRRALTSLTKQSRPADELIIIDDSETDSTKRVVTEFRNPLRETGTELVYRHRPGSVDGETGMTEARNRVLDRASSDIICYIDDDVVCPEAWLSAYETAYEEFPDAAAIGGPALAVTELGEEIELLKTTENQNRLNKYGECHTGTPNWVPSKPVMTSHVRGANMSFPTSVLEDIGGFNPVYSGPGFFEEIDVMARIWKQGGDIVYYPDVSLYHFNADEGADVTEQIDDPNVWYWAARNGIVFRYNVFPERFWTGLARILFYTKGWPGPLWKDAGAYILTRDQRRIQAVRGYIDGLRQVFGNR